MGSKKAWIAIKGEKYLLVFHIDDMDAWTDNGWSVREIEVKA